MQFTAESVTNLVIATISVGASILLYHPFFRSKMSVLDDSGYGSDSGHMTPNLFERISLLFRQHSRDYRFILMAMFFLLLYLIVFMNPNNDNVNRVLAIHIGLLFSLIISLLRQRMQR